MRLAAGLVALAALAGQAAACSVSPGPSGFAPAPGATSRVELQTHSGTQIIAQYDAPTRRYAHGVLGDSIEAGALTVARIGSKDATDCQSDTLTLDDAHVFEDLAPRLAHLDESGIPHIITVRAHRDKGAQLAIYQFVPETGLRLLATTPYIGQRNRWLAPAGIGDFDRDGRVEIAYVETPHLGKVLRFWRLEGGKLKQVAALRGVTNHRIGEAFISSATRTCGGTTEVLLASANWARTIAVTLDGTTPKWQDIGPWTGRDNLPGCPN